MLKYLTLSLCHVWEAVVHFKWTPCQTCPKDFCLFMASQTQCTWSCSLIVQVGVVLERTVAFQ